MMKTVMTGTLLCGGSILAYVSRNYWGQDIVALVIVGLIALSFGVGIWELWKSSKRFLGFEHELKAAMNSDLGEFSPSQFPPLKELSAELKTIVRGRLVGTPVPLPSPVGTSYLLGLLIMLGLLGTFFGLVETLQGARAVLAGSHEITAMREGLVAPIMGLSRAFGTSVGGVACSALLGLVAALVRHQRGGIHRRILQFIGGPLFAWSSQGRQMAAMESLSAQLAGMPLAVQGLHDMKDSIESLTGKMDEKHDALGEKLVSILSEVSSRVAGAMERGAELWVEKTAIELRPLLESAVDSAGKAAESHFTNWTDSLERHALAQRGEQEVWTNQFSGLVEELTSTLNQQERQRFDALNDQLTTLIEKFKIGLIGLGDENRECLGRFETTVGRFEVSMEELLSQIKTEHAGLGNRLVEVSQEFQEHQGLLGTKLNDHLQLACVEFGKSLAEIEKTHFANGESAVAAVQKLDEVVRDQLQILGEGLGTSLNEVVESASAAPKIAAEVMGQMQARLEDQMKRENTLIADRTELFDGLAEIAVKLNEAAIGHEAAITLMTEAGNAQLEKVGEETQTRLESALKEVTDASQLIAVGGHELSAMTEMFTIAVDEYRNSNERLLGGLDRIEEALGRAGERSDQQLNLYVSQAREIIDQSMLSQKEVFDELKHLRIQKPVEENA